MKTPIKLSKNEKLVIVIIGTAQFGMHYGIANQKGQVSLDKVLSILDLPRE